MNHRIFDILTKPTYFINRALYDVISEFAPQLRGKVLDVGCGSMPYKNLFSHAEYVGMEYSASIKKRLNETAIHYDGNTFPFSEKSFDAVLSTEVLEHVFNPDRFLSEIYRVLKPDGLLLITTPLLWKEHQQPHDFGRYSSYGLRHILEQHGFELIEQRKLVMGLKAITVLWNRYLKECITVKNYFLRTLIFIILISPWTLLALIISPLFPQKESTYIGNAVLAQKKV